MKVITAQQAVSMISDGMRIGIGGFGSYCAPDEILRALREQYKKSGSPKDLEIVTGVSTGDNGFDEQGHNLLAEKGLLDTAIASHFKMAGKLNLAADNNEFAGYTLPLGVLMNMLRSAGSGYPGYLSHVGLYTYVDPRVDTPAVNGRAKERPEKLCSLMQVDGEEMLYYKSLPLDVCILRATYADESGNISAQHEAIQESLLDYALATKNNGGKVIVQVEEIVQDGQLSSRDVRLSGTIVDYVVLAQPENHRQSFAFSGFRPELTGEYKIPGSEVEPMPLSLRKVVARRCCMELEEGLVINIGIGMPSGVGNVANEEEIIDDIVLSLETGPIKGIPVEGAGFGGCINAESQYTVGETLNYYDGGGLDMTFLGLAEADMTGNVNVSKFDGKCVGPGGFVDITQNTKTVCFVGGFFAHAPKLRISGGKLTILEEGTGCKFVEKVQQVTFSSKYAKKTNQSVYYITERAVFRLDSEGLMLIEIAPGIDLENDILRHMEFRPIIAKDLRKMDSRIFREERMGLKNSRRTEK